MLSRQGYKKKLINMISWINLISRNTFLLTCNKNGLDRNTLFSFYMHKNICLFLTKCSRNGLWLSFCLLMRIGKFVVVWLDSPDFSSVFGNCSIWTEFSGWCNIQNRHLRPQCRIPVRLVNFVLGQNVCIVVRQSEESVMFQKVVGDILKFGSISSGEVSRFQLFHHFC